MEQKTCSNCHRVFYGKGIRNGRELYSADRDARIDNAYDHCETCYYGQKWWKHDARCHGTLASHICTYYKKLSQSVYESFFSWNYDNYENRISRVARNGPVVSRGKQRACMYCDEDIFPGQRRYLIDRHISFHPECFHLHCLFIRQMMDEIKRHNSNFI